MLGISFDGQGVEVADTLKKQLVEVFKMRYRAVDLADKRFTLWVGDMQLDYLTRQDFQDQLQVCLGEEGFTSVVWHEAKLAIPPQHHDFKEIIPSVFLQEQCVEPTVRHLRAVVTALPGRGSLIKEAYILDSAQCQHYNIGVGASPQLPMNAFRENHIAIDDDITSVQYENNKFVSRSHAHIGFSEELGFYLQVEAGGSRVHSGNRTQVFRKQQVIEAENLAVPVVLQSGDIIVLGKTVALKFEELSNE